VALASRRSNRPTGAKLLIAKLDRLSRSAAFMRVPRKPTGTLDFFFHTKANTANCATTTVPALCESSSKFLVFSISVK
jgi:hypothetical protein